MNVGIDFNTKYITACSLPKGLRTDVSRPLLIRNLFAFCDGEVFIGNEGLNKFLTSEKAVLYDLNQIMEFNGVVINRGKISVEKCLSLLFRHTLFKIGEHSPEKNIDMLCISIPYEKFYYWREIISKAIFLMEGRFGFRTIQQPTAFFANSLGINSSIDMHKTQIIREQAKKAHENKPWYKKILSGKPTFNLNQNLDRDYKNYAFVAITRDNMNVSLAEYGSEVLEVKTTYYSDVVTGAQIEKIYYEYICRELLKQTININLADKKTVWRIKEIVDDILGSSQINKHYEVNLPYVLCADGQYRSLNACLELTDLFDSLSPIIDTIISVITEMIKQGYKLDIDAFVFLGETLRQGHIRDLLEIKLNSMFSASRNIFVHNNSLALGALNYSKIFTGDKKNYLALEVIPFSVHLRLNSGDLIELIEKDKTIPIKSKEQTFEISSDNKRRFIELHLITKEGEISQSLDVWKVEVGKEKLFKVIVDVDPNMKISLKASTTHSAELPVQRGKTFSLQGAEFEIGIKGQDIRQYVLNQFNYLSAIMPSDEVTIFEPDVAFYSMLKDNEPFKALRYIGYFLKLKSLPDVELKDSNVFQEEGLAGFISGTKICLPKDMKDDPYGYGYVLAHELAHYILIHEEGILLDDEQENEILTEIFVVYSGMGKLFLNGINTKGARDSAYRSHGYLNKNIIKHIHQIYFGKFNINTLDYKNSLTEDGLRILNDSAL